MHVGFVHFDRATLVCLLSHFTDRRDPGRSRVSCSLASLRQLDTQCPPNVQVHKLLRVFEFVQFLEHLRNP